MKCNNEFRPVFYRYDGYSAIYVTEYVSIKETPRAHWIIPKDCLSYWDYLQDMLTRNSKVEGIENEIQSYFKNIAKLIYPGSTKSFAYPSREDALRSYKLRKYWQVKHLTRQLKNAETGYKKATEMLTEEYGVKPFMPPTELENVQTPCGGSGFA